MYGPGQKHDAELDFNGPDRRAVGESVVTQACFGGAALVEWGGAGAVRFDPGH